MFKRLLGGKTPGKPPSSDPSAITAEAASSRAAESVRSHARGPAWDAPQTPYLSYFNVHIKGAPQERVVERLKATYLATTQTGAAKVILAEDNGWATAHVEPGLVRSVGFNKLASEVARDLDAWVIAYRIYAGEGMDVHYFRGATHLDQLALSEDELAFEPTSAEPFASLADMADLMPRRAGQHPLDFHFIVLSALGIRDAALTWEHALGRQQSGGFAASCLLPVEA